MKIQKVKFRVTEKYFGVPEPFIPDESLIILYQDGRAQIGKYYAATDENRSPYFSHPKNWQELEPELLVLIRKQFPEDIDDEDSNCYLLPEEYINKLLW